MRMLSFQAWRILAVCKQVKRMIMMMILPFLSSLFFVLRGTNHWSDSTTQLGVLSSRRTSSSSLSTKDVSKRLVASVCDQFQQKGLAGKSDEIEGLMQDLIQRQVSFDPSQCLNGPLFAVRYIDLGPQKTPPSWVKYTTQKSLVGQLYELKDPNSIQELRVVNYAEAFSGAIQLETEGSCALVENQDGDKKLAPPNWNPLAQLFSSQRPLLQCPVEYVIRPGSTLPSSVTVLGKKDLIRFKLEGQGTVRILYADPNLRILEAPPTKANWEPRGIRTVQVRVDLLPKEGAS